MFNFLLLKRSLVNLSCKYLACMILILSGVFIAVTAYNPDIIIAKTDSFFLLREIFKVCLICYAVYLLSSSRLGFFIAGILLVYSGICAGTYLMFIINNMSAVKLVISVMPMTIKMLGILTVYADMLMFEGKDNRKIITGGGLYLTGDILMSILL